MSSRVWSVTVAFATGTILNWQVPGNAGEIAKALAWLFKLGHVVTYTVEPAAEPAATSVVLSALCKQVGSLVMDAVAGCPLRHPEPPARLLVPVWSFTPQASGRLASTARFHGTDVEIMAVPSGDEETGFPIPGKYGLYLPLITPDPTWRASSVI